MMQKINLQAHFSEDHWNPLAGHIKIISSAINSVETLFMTGHTVDSAMLIRHLARSF